MPTTRNRRFTVAGFSRFLRWFGIVAAIAPVLEITAAAGTLFSTRFEAAEGYDETFVLVGQQGWQADGTGGSGLVSDFFPNEGQQAFIGFAPPTDDSASLTIFRPINADPVAAGTPIVQFSVFMSIFDSTNNRYDCFRWSVYNTDVTRLFTLDFDNETRVISYALQNSSNFVSTGHLFVKEELHRLLVIMNFSNNTWSASLDGSVLVNSKPITTGNARRTLGDIDAVWILRNRTRPGNNYMVFDNYAITAQAEAAFLESGRLEPGGVLPNRQFALSFRDGESQSYVIDVSSNLFNWVPLRTNQAPNGMFDFIDAGAAAEARRFYRTRLLP